MKAAADREAFGLSLAGASAYYPFGTYNVIYKCNSITWSGH